jgi:hypothetical protein
MEPDPQYEAFMAAFAETDEDQNTGKPKKKQRSQFTNAPRHSLWNNEEDNYNPANPSSTKSPDSYARRQEFLAKVSAAAGSKYISWLWNEAVWGHTVM